MSGESVKKKLKGIGITPAELAEKLGYSAQRTHSLLSAEDVKSGVIEMIAAAIGKDVCWFYQSDGSRTATASNGGIAVAGDNNNNHFASHEELMRTYMDAILQCVKSMERVVEGLAAKCE